jgi:hypothetical protein
MPEGGKANLTAQHKRVEISIKDLRKKFPETKDSILRDAFGIINFANLDQLDDRECVLWGQEDQEHYGQIVNICLKISQSQTLTTASSNLNLLLTLLGNINLAKICGQDSTKGLLERIFEKPSKDEIGSLESLKQAQVRLDQLIESMKSSLDELLALKARIQRSSEMIDHQGDKIEARAISAGFLSEYLSKTKPVLSRIFEDRSMSLTSTLAQIRESGTMRLIQIDQPLQMISNIQHVTLVTWPGLLGSIVSVRTILDRKQKPTALQMNELNDQLKNLIEKLKG